MKQPRSRFSVVAADLDADPLVLSVLSGLPDGALFVPERGEFVWTPTFEQDGDYTVPFLAQDPFGAEGELDVLLNVSNVNRAPQLAESNHFFLLGEESSFTLTASDPDNTPLTFSGTDLPEGATLDSTTGEFKWTPGPGTSGAVLVSFTVSDGLVSRRQNVILFAELEPIPPTVRIEQTPSFRRCLDRKC